jgi:hypothetical protein
MMDGRMRVALEGFQIAVDGQLERVDAEIIAAGAYVIVLVTVLEDRGVQLVSSYLASLAGPAAATHMWTTADAPRFEHRTLNLPGTRHARGCLLDHAAELRSLLADELGGTTVVRIDVSEHALGCATRVWSGPEAS